ncbi:nucleotide exchange factor GrpE [Streptomyces sp. NPDC048650]|uniref:nucleotide exchange factor GrpE n=1 Tax=unclassified Streptomyces TaxID=2593676 RepID=UPI003718C151
MNRPTGARGHPHPPLSIVRDRPHEGPAVLPPRACRAPDPADPDGRTPADQDAAVVQPVSPEAALGAELRERTADLQRLKAEYDNYRKRVRRDRLAVGEAAVANVLARLLPVLDALAEAAEQGELTGGFRQVGEALEAELAALGLESFGTPGAPFDPVRHEAITYTAADLPAGQAERAVCAAVLRRGYRVGGRLLRPAQVAVTEEARIVQ